MFAKPYKLKSNNTLKNSEKKQLAQRIRDEFPSVSEDRVKELVSVKANCSCMKLTLQTGDTAAVYVVDGIPTVLDTERGLVPTVCALWKVPELLPTIIIHSPVLSKMVGGAPLYLPGVVLPPGGVPFPMFPRGALLAARTHDNAAAALVGRAILPSADMLMKTGGVCLETIQIYGDLLCKEPKFVKIERPHRGIALYGMSDLSELTTDIAQLTIQPPAPAREEWPALGPAPRPPSPAPAAPAPAPGPAPNAPRVLPEPALSQFVEMYAGDAVDEGDAEDDDSIPSESPPEQIPADMDGLLEWCLLSFLKLEGKSLELPLKISLLYRNHLIPLCPPARTLDVKKSSYKKMGKFLEAMQKEGLLEVREVEKGVDALVGVNPAHPRVRAHRPAPRPPRPPAPRPQHGDSDTDYAAPLVREMYCVTAHVAALLCVKKGTALTAAEVRAGLMQHVRAGGAGAGGAGGAGAGGAGGAPRGSVALDAALAQAVGKHEQEHMKWEELMSAVLARMTPATEMRFADGSQRLTKSRLEPIKMQVVTRSGNKKVTLVSNLEAYGFALGALARACPASAGAACGVTRAAGARADQLMLQGDQTHFVAKLLIEKYGLPKKFVEGADKALNKKK